MEGVGIDLSNRRARKWADRYAKYLRQFFSSVALALLSGGVLLWQAADLSKENQQVIQKVQTLNQEIAQIRAKIAHLHSHTTNSATRLTPNEVEDFLDYLTHLPIQGGLEFAQFYAQEESKLKLTGKLIEQQHFTKLEHQLKTMNKRYTLENLQSNEKHQTEFSMLIYWGSEEEK